MTWQDVGFVLKVYGLRWAFQILATLGLFGGLAFGAFWVAHRSVCQCP